MARWTAAKELLSDTLRPLLLAPLGAVAAFTAFGLSLDGAAGLALFAVMVWAYSLCAAMLLVVPVLAVAPRLRRPPVWLAIIWGAMAALLAGWWVFDGAARLVIPSLAAGGTSGFVYALVARGSRR